MAMEPLTPTILKAGDSVGLVAPARKVSEEEIAPAIKMFEEWGLKVVLGDHLYGSNNQFSGTDTERATDFMKMVENPEVRAIICARGGYGAVRLLDHLNLRALQRDPKWVVGYSDITVFHGKIGRASWRGRV